jgi:hypothetical protein
MAYLVFALAAVVAGYMITKIEFEGIVKNSK